MEAQKSKSIVVNRKEVIKLLQETNFDVIIKEDGKKYSNKNSINFFKWYKDDSDKITINIESDHLLVHKY